MLSEKEIGISEHKYSIQLINDDITDDTLVLTMTFSEKVKLMEDFGITKNVYTIGEFIEEDTDVINPYGSDEEHYENFMVEIKKRVERVILRIEAIYHEEGGTNNGSNRQ